MNKDFDLENEFVSKPKERINHRIFVLAAGMLCFVLLSWYAYRAFAPDEEVYDIPIIEADSEITKIKPLDPGGIHMSNMDKDIYNNISQENLGNVSEKLLPLPEEPIASNQNLEVQKEEKLEDLLLPLSAEIDKLKSDTKDVEVQVHAQAKVKSSEDMEALEKKELPDLVKEDISKIASIPEVIQVNKKKSLTKIASKKIIEQKAPVGKYKIQLASMKSEKHASQEWSRLKAKHKTILGNTSHSIEKRNLKDKGTYYCVHGGPFKTYSTASAICKKLIAKSQNCIVVENK